MWYLDSQDAHIMPFELHIDVCTDHDNGDVIYFVEMDVPRVKPRPPAPAWVPRPPPGPPQNTRSKRRKSCTYPAPKPTPQYFTFSDRHIKLAIANLLRPQ